ncbi:hypothetical protein [Actinoplanes sp. NPDC051851]|uniref:hypothetical protein n=1 Tax=Actinoplanes sp. NPDC051851 TaxID=3154753 RepID=UPI0034207549
MAENPVFLDPEPHSWRSRRIEVQSGRRHAVITLNRDGYVDTHHDESGELSPEFQETVDRLRMVFIDRLVLDGNTGSFAWGGGGRYITLHVPYPCVDEVVDALRIAEVDKDVSGLKTIADRLALPIDQWLEPGERLLRRGVDFDARPSTFLRFLRLEARHQGLRLNGRATAVGVWIRPQLSATEKLSRAVFPERYQDRPDRWTGARQPDGPWRPDEDRIRDPNNGTVVPVAFREVPARPRSNCPCGVQNAFGTFDLEGHEEQHQLWSLGVRVPRNVSWDFGNVAVVTTESNLAWRRLAAKIAVAPKRENHYDFTSWEAGTHPKPSSTNRRAYLLRGESTSSATWSPPTSTITAAGISTRTANTPVTTPRSDLRSISSGSQPSTARKASGALSFTRSPRTPDAW